MISTTNTPASHKKSAHQTSLLKLTDRMIGWLSSNGSISKGVSLLPCPFLTRISSVLPLCLVRPPSSSSKHFFDHLDAGICSRTLRIAGLDNPFLASTIIQVILIVGIITSFYVVERVGRRTLVLWGGAAMGCIDVAIGGIGFKTPDSATGAGLITVCSFWVLVYSLSLAPIGESGSGRTVFYADGTRMGFSRGELKSSFAGQDRRRRYHSAILVKYPLCTYHIRRAYMFADGAFRAIRSRCSSALKKLVGAARSAYFSVA